MSCQSFNVKNVFTTKPKVQFKIVQQVTTCMHAPLKVNYSTMQSSSLIFSQGTICAAAGSRECQTNFWSHQCVLSQKRLKLRSENKGFTTVRSKESKWRENKEITYLELGKSDTLIISARVLGLTVQTLVWSQMQPSPANCTEVQHPSSTIEEILFSSDRSKQTMEMKHLHQACSS